MVAGGKLCRRDKIGLGVGKVIGKYKMAKHFDLDIQDAALSFSVNEKRVAAEAALDGIYVIRTSAAKAEMSAEADVLNYKRLAEVSLSLLATLSYALYILWTRYLARFDDAQTTLVYTPLAGALLVAPLALASWQTPKGVWVWLVLLSTVLFGGFGHWLVILAHERAPAPILAPFGYISIIYMIALGLIVFGEFQAGWALASAAIIIMSGVYLLFRERQAPGAEGAASSATVVEG